MTAHEIDQDFKAHLEAQGNYKRVLEPAERVGPERGGELLAELVLEGGVESGRGDRREDERGERAEGHEESAQPCCARAGGRGREVRTWRETPPRRPRASPRSADHTRADRPEWVGGRVTLPLYVTEGEPYRPQGVMWVELPSRLILGWTGAPGEATEVVVAPTPELDELVRLFAESLPDGDERGVEGHVAPQLALPASEFKLSTAVGGRRHIGRNDPCPCGSGKKYKRCHLGADAGGSSGATGAEPGGPTAPVETATLHELDRRLADVMAGYARERFGQAWLRFVLDFADAELASQLSLHWALYHLRIRGRTVAGHFLAERGERLSGEERAWLEAQSRSWLSIWEVQSARPGESLDLKDLLTGERRQVVEASGSAHARATHRRPSAHRRSRRLLAHLRQPPAAAAAAGGRRRREHLSPAPAPRQHLADRAAARGAPRPRPHRGLGGHDRRAGGALAHPAAAPQHRGRRARLRHRRFRHRPRGAGRDRGAPRGHAGSGRTRRGRR